MPDQVRNIATRGVAIGPPPFSFRLLVVFTAALAALALPVGVCAADTIKIAVALPMTGAHAALGRDIKAAAEMALADYGARKSLTARDIELSFEDDGCSADGGLAAARRITADPRALPLAVVGHACSSAAQMAAPLYAAAGIIFIAAGSLPARLPVSRRFGPRHFMLPGDGAQGTVIASVLLEAGPQARIAFVRDRTQFAQAALLPVQAALTARGRSVLAVETYAGAEKDFAAIAQRLKALAITHIALAAFASEAVLLVAELRKAIPALVIVATDQLADPEFAQPVTRTAEGVQVALAPDYRAFPGAIGVAKRLQDNGIEPSRSALASFAAIEVLTAAEATGALGDGAAALDALNGRPFETILGPIRFDAATGAASLPSHVLYTWTGGKLLPPSR